MWVVAPRCLTHKNPQNGEQTPMGKPNKKRYKLSTLRESYASKRGSSIDIEADDGKVFSLPAPGFWDDEVTELARENKTVEIAKALLADQYPAFREAGGRAMDVMLAVESYTEDQGIQPGESVASSDS